MTDYVDPHKSKISPDDPRLRLPRTRIRRLRRGPAFAALGALLVLIFVSVAVATNNTGRRTRKAPEDDLSKAFRRPSLPPELLKAPDYVAPEVQAASPVERAVAVETEEAHDPKRAKLELPSTSSAPAAGRGRGGPYSPEALRQKQIEEFWAARRAGVFIEMPRDSERAFDDGARRAPEPSAADELGAPPPPPMPAMGAMGAMGAEPSVDALGVDPSMQARKEAFLQSRTRGDGYLKGRLQRSRSPYELKAGSIIPAVLETGINSDLPGPVFARVREDVYDTVTGRYLLIPQNSKLVASYDSRVAWGQERVLLCWQQLILPNGNSLNLDCMPAADLSGAAGLTDEVDEHWWRLVKGAGIASMLSAATTAAGGNTTGFQPTVPQQFARGAASEIGRAGDRITQRNLRIQPTITVRPGWSLNVMVIQTIDQLEPYPER